MSGGCQMVVTLTLGLFDYDCIHLIHCYYNCHIIHNGKQANVMLLVAMCLQNLNIDW